jgi:hypothetical protein
MKLSTCKGEFEGTVHECSAWLESVQPSFVAVVVGGFEVTPDGLAEGSCDESGFWTDGVVLRQLLLDTESEAAWAGPQVVEFHPGLAVRVDDGGAVELAREVYAASDEGGTIQADQMLELFPWGDPRWHTATSLRDALGYVGKVFTPCEEG